MTIGFYGGKFLPFHMGHLNLIVEASLTVDRLYVVLTYNRERDRLICEKDGFESVEPTRRAAWIGEAVSGLDHVEVLTVEDFDTEYDWDAGAEAIKRAIGHNIDTIFSSEPDYDPVFKRNYPGARHIVMDSERLKISVSASDIRRNLYAHWDDLPRFVRKDFVKKVCITGTESCGKSQLTRKLALAYNTAFVDEVGRRYCERYSNQLTGDMFDRIAAEHLNAVQSAIESANRILFVDTDAVVTQYYLGIYLNGRSEVLDALSRNQPYDLYLYLEPDVDWVDDGLRFKGEPAERIRLNEALKSMYCERGIEIISISGNFEERYRRVCESIDRLI